MRVVFGRNPKRTFVRLSCLVVVTLVVFRFILIPIRVSGLSMTPTYRDGDIIVVSPAAPVRRGDRVVAKTRKGEVMVKELKRQTGKQVELKSLNSEHPDRTIANGDLVWIARIVWASQ